jgi:hypothetical protein
MTTASRILTYHIPVPSEEGIVNWKLSFVTFDTVSALVSVVPLAY